MRHFHFFVILCFFVSRFTYSFQEGAGGKEKNNSFVNLYHPKYILDMYHSGLHRVKAKARTDECKAHIEFEYMKHHRAVSEERPFPFEDIFFHSQCEKASKEHHVIMPVGMRKPPPRLKLDPKTSPPNTATMKSAADVAILYILLLHDHASFAQRLIHALDEPQHTFVVHVDTKSGDVYDALVKSFPSPGQVEREWGSGFLQGSPKRTKGNVFIMNEGRQSVNWGGFSVVNATLNAMRFAMERNILFDYMLDVSGTTYPLVSNEAIRTKLAKLPGYTYMDVHSNPSRPSADMWHSYVECDDNLHRISRLSTLRGMNMHVGSQWFALPYHVVYWFLNNRLPLDYVHYAKRVVVADEHYFATLYKNSPYCTEHVPENMLFVLFDKWEHDKIKDPRERNNKKCLHPDPNHCGRSPTTLTTEYTRILQVSQHLFARKFNPALAASIALLDDIDRWRQDPAHRLVGSTQNFMIKKGGSEKGEGKEQEQAEGEEHSNSNSNDTCMRLGPDRHAVVQVMTCNASDPYQWFTLGRCTGNSTENKKINLSENHCGMFINTAGTETWEQSESRDSVLNAAAVGIETHDSTLEERMACQIQSAVQEKQHTEEDTEIGTNTHTDTETDTSTTINTPSLCMDISGESPKGGTPLIGWDCTGNWNQLFHYNEDCSISAVQPRVIAEVRGLPQNITRCISTSNGNGNGKIVTVKTADCLMKPKNNKIEAEAQAHAEDSSVNIDVAMPIPVPITGAMREQQWQIMPKEGSLWRTYLYPAVVSSSAADNTFAHGEDEDEEL